MLALSDRLLLRSECKEIVRLAIPIVIAQFAQSANGFVDTVMAGQVSPRDLAAVAVGSSIWVPLFLFFVGIMQGLTPFVSQYHGANRNHHIGPLIQQGLWLALPLGCLGFVLLRSVAPLLDLMEVEESIAPLITDYLIGLSWGFPAITLFLAFRSLTEGTSRTRPVMIVSLIGLMVNIPVNYILIYGKLGFPAMGGVGCGWATSVVMWLMLGLIVLYNIFLERLAPSGVFKRLAPPNANQLFAIMKVGLPIGLSIFIEVSLFCVIALFIAGIGPNVVAGHQIALNATSMMFMIPLSLSLALTVRVGRNLGQNNVAGVKRSTAIGLIIIVVLASAASMTMILANSAIASIYTDDPELIKMASALLLFAAAFQISDGLQVGASGVLRGMKDTSIPMLITVLAYWCLGLPIGYTLGLTDWLGAPMGAQGFWIGLIAGLSFAALFLCWRVKIRLKTLSIN